MLVEVYSAKATAGPALVSLTGIVPLFSVSLSVFPVPGAHVDNETRVSAGDPGRSGPETVYGSDPSGAE